MIELLDEIPEPAPQERPGRIEYLYLTPEQSELSGKIDETIDRLPANTRLRCWAPEVKTRNDKEVAFYPHVDYDERTPPTKEEADLMCRTSGVLCPIASLCFEYGVALQAPVGVWGGQVLVDGKPYYK